MKIVFLSTDCSLEYCMACGGSPVQCLKCSEGYLMDNSNTCRKSHLFVLFNLLQ